MEVEVIFRRNVSKYKKDDTATFDSESVFLKAILMGEHAEVLNPPDFTVFDEKHYSESPHKDKEAEHESSSKHEASGSDSPTAPSGAKRTGTKGESNPPKTTGDSA